MWIYFLIIAVVVLLDQLTKQIVLHTIPVGESVNFIPGVFRFTHVKNPGAAFIGANWRLPHSTICT